MCCKNLLPMFLKTWKNSCLIFGLRNRFCHVFHCNFVIIFIGFWCFVRSIFYENVIFLPVFFLYFFFKPRYAIVCPIWIGFRFLWAKRVFLAEFSILSLIIFQLLWIFFVYVLDYFDYVLITYVEFFGWSSLVEIFTSFFRNASTLNFPVVMVLFLVLPLPVMCASSSMS